MRFRTDAGTGEASLRGAALYASGEGYGAFCTQCGGPGFRVIIHSGGCALYCEFCGSTAWAAKDRRTGKHISASEALGGVRNEPGDVVCEAAGRPWERVGVHRSTWYRRIARVVEDLASLQRKES